MSSFLINPIIIILHMHSSHHSITLNALKNNDPFFLTFFSFLYVWPAIATYFFMFQCDLQDNTMYFFQFSIYSIQPITCFIYISYILNIFFYFSYLTCTFHFNCCLNIIFIIVNVNKKILEIQL